MARAGRKKQKSENGNGAPLGFEAKLWLAADKPKLLSGEIRVTEAEQAVAEVS